MIINNSQFQKTAETNASGVGLNRQLKKGDDELKLQQGNDLVSLGSQPDADFLKAMPQNLGTQKQGTSDGKVSDDTSQPPQISPEVAQQLYQAEQAGTLTADQLQKALGLNGTIDSKSAPVNPNNPSVAKALADPQFQQFSQLSPGVANHLLQLIDSGNLSSDQLQNILTADSARRDMELSLLKYEETERQAIRDTLLGMEQQRAQAEMDRMKNYMAFTDYLRQGYASIWASRMKTTQAISDICSKFWG
jgi:hypothetical protein